MGLRASSLAGRSVSLRWVVSSTAHHQQVAAVRSPPPPPPPTSAIVSAETGFHRKRISLNEGRSSVAGGAQGRRTPRADRKSRHTCRHSHARCSHSRSHHTAASRFGYEITDVDAFLTKASLDSPANIPVVLSSPCLLYQTRIGGYQDERSLPLGTVVNAVFKNQGWLYVQTPHGEEGYVQYTACLPLGILPPKTPAPCWETHTDIFPQPVGGSGNRIKDNEKFSGTTGTRSEYGGVRRRLDERRGTMSVCGERSVDRLYLRATANQISRQTLLVICTDYMARGRSTLSVSKGDVVYLISDHMKDWFWVRNRDGKEGFIPAVVAGHGFL